MKVCPKCNKEWPDEFQACPLDGTTLVLKSQTPSGFNLNLGDANAISGGVNLSDNHSVSNNTVNTTTSNVDSHNVINNNITHVEREKSPEERLLEAKNAFREACQKVFSNGMCTSEEKRELDDLKFSLGLDDEVASQIFENARMSVQRKFSVLGPVQKITLQNIKAAIASNSVENINKYYPQLFAMVQKFSAEELQFIYYMLQASLFTEKCIADYEKHREDKYWQTFWACVAYRNNGNVIKSETLLADVGSKWTDTIPEENTFILATVCSIIDGDVNTAQNLFSQVTGGQSVYLEPLVGSLYGYLYPEMMSTEEVQTMAQEGIFYTEHLLRGNILCTTSSVPTASKGVETKKEEQTVKLDSQIVSNKRAQGTVAVDAEVVSSSVQERPKTSAGIRTVQDILTDYRNDYGDLRNLGEDEIEDTFEEITRVANQGNDEAKLLLAQMYENGIGTDVNHKKAFELYKSSAMNGFKPAAIALGICYLYGIGVKKDVKEADKRIRLGMTTENPRIMKAIGDLFLEKGSQAQADIWYKKASDNGCTSIEKTNKKSVTVKSDRSVTKPPVVQIKSIRIEDGASFNGQTGFWVLTSWVVDNLQNNKVTIAANFFWAVGAKILAGKSSFTSSDGQLSSFEETEPLPYESTCFDDFRLFMPYSELPTKRDGTFHMKLRIEVSKYSDFKKIQLMESDDYIFDVIVNGSKIVVK